MNVLKRRPGARPVRAFVAAACVAVMCASASAATEKPGDSGTVVTPARPCREGEGQSALQRDLARGAGEAIFARRARPALEPLSVAADPLLAASLGRITADRVREIVGGLTGERPVTVDGARQVLGASDRAGAKGQRYVAEILERQGLVLDHSTSSVVGVRAGEVRPSEIILVTAHLNADGGWPGADDNASGSAAVVLAAEALGRHQFERTIRFVLFPIELTSSAEYATPVAANGENVVAVVNLDMVGNDAGQNRSKVFTVGSDAPTFADEMVMANAFVDVAQTYALTWFPSIDTSCG